MRFIMFLLLLSGCLSRSEDDHTTSSRQSDTRTTELVEGTQAGQPVRLRKSVVSETITNSEARSEREATIRIQPMVPTGGFDWPSLLVAGGTALLGGHATGFLHGRKQRAKNP